MGRCMADGYREERRLVAGALRALSPDIIHVHWTQMGHALGALDSGIPVVVTVHDAALTCAYWNWSWHPGAAISCVRGVEFTRRVLRGASRIIAVSPYVKQHVEGVFLRRGEVKVSVIPNPVTDGEMAPTLGQREMVEGPVFAAVGHWGALKRFDLILRAFGEVVKKQPGATLLLVGKDLGEMGPAQRWAMSRGLDRRVSFLGSRSHEFIMRLLSTSAHCLVHPSRSEGFGLAVAEAMLLGVPVIASHAGALPWLLEDGRAGVVVRSASVAAWSEAMIRVVEAQAPGGEVQGRVDRAVARIRELCDPAAVACQHREVYEGVLAQ